MPIPILRTKLHIPPLSNSVPRPRLVQRLAQAVEPGYRLILISAPAGFGKTTLLSDWARHTALPVAWLSLDQADNNPARFLAYLSAALEKIQPAIHAERSALLQSLPLSAAEPILIALINHLDEPTSPFALILDDYHTIDAPAVHDAVTFLFDHLPAHAHLIIAGRSDPPLPLARLRGRDQLSELRAADLAFTPAEAAAFLNGVMNLNLTDENVAALEERTEGWIVGLQMAALSMRGREDRSGFIQAFTGSHRFVLDYLIEEVLDRQTPATQDFLLKTSILEQMTASLCEAVTGESNAQVTLLQLEQSNLFVVPLDDERRWYRYHHLFADLLHARLVQTRPDQMAELYRRASRWYAQNDLIAEAMNAAVAAGDVDQVARLAESNVIAMMDHGELSQLINWMNAVPPEVMQARPWLSVAHAWVLSYTGQFAAVEPRLQAAEQMLPQLAEGDARIVGHIATIRSYLALLRGETGQAMELALDALQSLRERDLLARSFALRVLGLTHRIDGDLEDALKLMSQACELSRSAGDSHLVMTALHDLALLQFVRGELPRAVATCQEALQLAEDHRRRGGGQLPATGYIYGLLGRLLCEQNDLETAIRYAHAGVALSRQWELTEVLIDCYLYLAGVLQTCGDLDGACEAIHSARQMAGCLSEWYVTALGPYEARLHLARGDMDQAVRWAATQQAVTDFGHTLSATFNGLTLARIFMAQRRYGEALPVLDQVLHGSAIVHAIDHVIEALILQALVFQALHKAEPAADALKRALSLAEPAGYIRLFVDEGAPMGDLLRLAAARGIAINYVNRLLTALQADQDHKASLLQPSALSPHPSASD